MERIGCSAAARFAAGRYDVQIDSALVWRQTCCVLAGELEYQASIVCLEILDWILRDDSMFVLNLDRDLLVVKEPEPLVDDFGQFGCIEPMLKIVCDPNLQHATGAAAQSPSAVDKSLLHMSDLGDVKVSRDRFSSRQDHFDRAIRMAFQRIKQVN